MRGKGEGGEPEGEEEGAHQYCVKTSMPTTPSMLVCPVRDCRETVTFRPPPSMMPCRDNK